MIVMRPLYSPKGICVLAALGLIAAVGSLTLSAPAHAQDSGQSFDSKVFGSVLRGLGLRNGDEPQINYQERAPLVIPPNSDLPPPENANAAVNNAAWPNDPDIARARIEAAKARNRNIQAEIETEQNALRPDQMTPGAKKGKPLRSARKVDNPSVSGDGTDRLNPKELGYHGGLWGNMFGPVDDRSIARFTGEAPRAELTDPPAGYMTPSPAQPYGAGKDRVNTTATDYYKTHGTLESAAGH